MDTQKFLNKYIASLAEQVKSLSLDKTMVATQLAMALEENEELKKKIMTLEEQVSLKKVSEDNTPALEQTNSGNDIQWHS